MSHQDGRCAADAETIYVKLAGCSGTGGGTAATPYCDAQQAFSALAADRRVIVVRGSVDKFSWAGSGAQVTVVGQANGQIAGGATPAVTLTGGDLYMRDLTFSLSAAAAIVAQSSSTLRLHHSKVMNSPGGGILIDGANFDLDDVLVSGNGQVFDGPTGWSGIYVKALPSSGPAALGFVTAINNGHSQIVCQTPLATAPTTVYADGTTKPDVVNCGFSSCTPAAVGTCGSSLSP